MVLSLRHVIGALHVLSESYECKLNEYVRSVHIIVSVNNSLIIIWRNCVMGTKERSIWQ